MKKSKFGLLNLKDYLRGLLMAIGTSILISLATILNSGAFPTLDQLIPISTSGLAAGLFYLVKNVLTNSNDNLLKKETE
jgi:hypothetical protein